VVETTADEVDGAPPLLLGLPPLLPAVTVTVSTAVTVTVAAGAQAVEGGCPLLLPPPLIIGVTVVGIAVT